MTKFKRHTANTVRFLYDNPLILAMLSLVLSVLCESYSFVNIVNETHELNPQTLSMFADFFKTPLGLYILSGVLMTYIVLIAFIFFLISRYLLRFSLVICHD